MNLFWELEMSLGFAGWGMLCFAVGYYLGK
jgi:hypothetical protein